MIDELPKDWVRHPEFWADEKSFKELDDKLNLIADKIDKRKDHNAWVRACDDISYARWRWSAEKELMGEKMNISGNENFKVKDFDLEYTGGGISVAYGIYDNGLGFSIGSDLLFVYDEDARNEFVADDGVTWEEEHTVFDDLSMGVSASAALFKSTLRQVFEMERKKHKNVPKEQILNSYDLFRENTKILNSNLKESYNDDCIYLSADEVGGLYNLLDIYLTWNGIIGYTDDIFDIIEYTNKNWNTLWEVINGFLTEEGIYGYTSEICDLLTDGDVAIDGMDEEDLSKLKHQLGINENYGFNFNSLTEDKEEYTYIITNNCMLNIYNNVEPNDIFEDTSSKYLLGDYDEEIADAATRIVANGYDSNLAQFSNLEFLKSFKFNKFENVGDGINWVAIAKTNKILSAIEKRELEKFVISQTADGWGESFEQKEVFAFDDYYEFEPGDAQYATYEVYISTWFRGQNKPDIRMVSNV